MKEGEISTVIIPPKLGFEYGNPQGFHGMGKPIPPNSFLKFELELLFFEKDLLKIEDLDDEEKIKYGNKIKLEGNDCFKEKKMKRPSNYICVHYHV